MTAAPSPFSSVARMDEMGWKFWASMVGIIVGLGLAGLVFVSLLGLAFASWGFFGAILLTFAIVAAIAWWVDRRRSV